MLIRQAAAGLVEAFGANMEQLKNVLDLFPLGVIMTDLDGLVVYYNNTHARIDGLDPQEVLGHKEIEVLVPVTGPNVMNVCQKTRQPILGYIYPYRTIKGRVVNAAYWVYPVFKDNKVSGSICFTQPLLGEYAQGRPYANQPIQWPGTVPINMPQKNIVGNNKHFQKALQTIKSNASNPFPILISGETGSGKEMLAKLCHQASTRRNKTYMALNCSAIPDTLLEGLLFGTVKGSFTGAIDRPGLLEEANGGTLYLDEIDSMPLELQPKLLRAIQEMRISRVGSSTEIKLDLKLVSSIGSSPQNALSSSLLRPDLFYRLAVVVVNIPPLRERPDDLETLTEHFLCKYNNLLGKEALMVDDALWSMMKAYHWPGNVRELEHLLTGALAQVRDENFIGIEHVPDHYLQAFGSQSNKDSISIRNSMFFQPVHQPATDKALQRSGPVERLQKEESELRHYLVQSRGNISRAAKLMGVSRQLFSYRMLKFGLNHRDYK